MRIKETSTTMAGDTQTIDILPGPAEPGGINATDCTTKDNNNGKISGVDTSMEYKLSAASSWSAVNGSEITNLNAGTYDVRIKTTGHTLPGAAKQVTINAYNPVTVNKLEMNAYVTAPAKNGTPNTTGIETDQYTGTVSWKDASGNPVSDKFLGGTVYTATVTLTPKQGYTFQGIAANTFTYSGVAVTHAAGDDENLVVSITFPATAARVLQYITITTEPKLSYIVDETFETAGMQIMAAYDDGTTDDNFTAYTVDKTEPLTISDTTVTITAADTTDVHTSLTITVDKKDGPAAPDVTFSFDGEHANKLMGATTLMEYSLDDGSTWFDCSENMDLTGAAITTIGIKVRVKTTETTKAGEIQTISISKAPTPSAAASNATVSGKGTLTGVTAEMECKLSTASTWTIGDGNPISLDPGTYHVRVKATGTVLASDFQELTIEPFVKSTPSELNLTFSLTVSVYDGAAKPLYVTAVSGKNLGAITVYYNGSTTAPVNAGTYGITVDIAGNEEYNAVTGLSLGDYIIEKANYTVSTTAFKTVHANKAETNLKVALPSLPDGAGYALSGTVGGSAGLIASHSVAGTTLTFSTNCYEVASATITFPVSGANNYNDYTVVVTITAVDKEIISISGLTAATNLVYNGMPQPGFAGTVTVSGDKVPTNELVYTYTSTDGGGYNGTTPPINAGTYKLVVSVAEENEDYAGAHTEIVFTIAKATITVTAISKSAYVGDPVPALGENDYTVAGLVSGEALKTVPTLAYASTPDMTRAGTAAITITGAEAPDGGNYNVVIHQDGVLTIISRPASGGGSGGGGSTPSAPVAEVKNGDSVPKSNLGQLIAENKPLTVAADNGAKLVFDTDALKGISSQALGDVKVEIRDVTPTYQEELPDKLVFSLTVSSGSGAVSNFGGKVTVSLPYELKPGETPDKVTVWHLADDGAMTEIPCTYDPVTKLASFTVTHFSLYVVGVADEKPWVNPFTDVDESDWFFSAVAFASRNGLFTGTGADTFSPGSPMTRAMLWTVLGRLDGQTLSGSGVYEAARIWAMSKGITDGSSPDGNITREQLVTILWRYAGSPKAGGNLDTFSDAGSVSGYAADAMAWAVENGIVEGAGGALMPRDNATRAQVAAILQRYITKIAQ